LDGCENMNLKDMYEYLTSDEELAVLLHAYLEENGIKSERKGTDLTINMEEHGLMVIAVHTVKGLPGADMTIVHTSNLTKKGYKGGAMRFDIYDPKSFPEALAMIQKDIDEIMK